MPDEPTQSDRVQRAIERARTELAEIPSVKSQVLRRIAATEIKPHPLARRALEVAVTMVVIFAGYFLLHPAAHRSQRAELAAPISDVSLNVNGVDLTEHLAAIMANRNIVVVWSCQGAQVQSENGFRSGKYRLIYQRHDALADGRTLVCSIFAADPGVSLVCEPPLIHATAADHEIVALTAAPRRASSNDLAAAIRNAGGADDLVRDIQMQSRQ